MSSHTLLAVPNVSEGRDQAAIDKLAEAFDARLLDIHSDPDHHRSVFTLAGDPGQLAGAVLNGAREAVARIDISRHRGAHPRVGVIDVAPIVYLDDAHRGAACAEALVLADLLATELGLPVFLYGVLARGRELQRVVVCCLHQAESCARTSARRTSTTPRAPCSSPRGRR